MLHQLYVASQRAYLGLLGSWWVCHGMESGYQLHYFCFLSPMWGGEREREKYSYRIFVTTTRNFTCTPSNVLLFRCTTVTFSCNSLPLNTFDTVFELDVVPVVMLSTPALVYTLTSMAGGSKQLNRFTLIVAFSKPSNRDVRQNELVQFCATKHGSVPWWLGRFDWDNIDMTSHVETRGESV